MNANSLAEVEIGQDRDLTVTVRHLKGEGRTTVFLDNTVIGQHGEDDGTAQYPIKADVHQPWYKTLRVRTVLKDVDPSADYNDVAEEIQILSEANVLFRVKNEWTLQTNGAVRTFVTDVMFV